MLQGQAKRKKAKQVGGASGKVDNYFFIIACDNNNYRLFLRIRVRPKAPLGL